MRDPMSAAGSSPRGRGPQHQAAHRPVREGLIPARAGTTPTPSPTWSRWWAHPRAGGDHDVAAAKKELADGSSPRGRGPRAVRLGHVPLRRLIPARAGTTGGRRDGDGGAGAHPRAGGDHAGPPTRVWPFRGSSPRGRGPPGHAAPVGAGGGLIPARAGTTPAPAPRTRFAGAHPRAGGDHEHQDRFGWACYGSSPRGRGPRCPDDRSAVGAGLIPARAGTTAASRDPSARTWAHPRAGGDHAAPALPARGRSGSSPRGRGPPAERDRQGQRRRLIPARAGTTGPRPPIPTRTPAHPRAGGDHSWAVITGSAASGSSPRGRGPHAERMHHPRRGRLIPARAGTTTRRGDHRRGRRAHPRAGGDHAGMDGGKDAVKGSSPRGRGPLRYPSDDERCHRLIPARAGTTCPPRTRP